MYMYFVSQLVYKLPLSWEYMLYFLVSLIIHKYILMLREYWTNKLIKYGGKRSEGHVVNLAAGT